MVWSEVGQAITIQCQSSETLQDSLTLTKGLNEEVEAVFVDRTTQNFKIADPFKGRLQLNNRFPTVDIRIKNLTSNDTGPYWCVYKRFDTQSTQIITSKGQGSVLLVVTGEPHLFIYFAKLKPIELHMDLVIIQLDTFSPKYHFKECNV